MRMIGAAPCLRTMMVRALGFATNATEPLGAGIAMMNATILGAQNAAATVHVGVVSKA